MASLYTDEAREERYFRLRAKKKRLDRVLDILMWLTLLCAAVSIIPGFAAAFLNGVFLGDLHALLDFVWSVAVYALAIYAIYCKNPKYAFCAIVGIVAISILFDAFSVIGLITLLPVLWVDKEWAKLEKEEGFPLFDMSYAEREERTRTAEERARNRALQAGARVASSGQTSDMGDLLDAGHDTMVIAPALHGQHDRYRGSVAGQTERPQFVPGVMDTLETIGGRQQPVHSPLQDPNVPELQRAPESLPTLDAMDAPVQAAEPQQIPAAAEAPQPVQEVPLYDSSADDEILGALAALNGGTQPQ